MTNTKRIAKLVWIHKEYFSAATSVADGGVVEVPHNATLPTSNTATPYVGAPTVPPHWDPADDTTPPMNFWAGRRRGNLSTHPAPTSQGNNNAPQFGGVCLPAVQCTSTADDFEQFTTRQLRGFEALAALVAEGGSSSELARMVTQGSQKGTTLDALITSSPQLDGRRNSRSLLPPFTRPPAAAQPNGTKGERSKD